MEDKVELPPMPPTALRFEIKLTRTGERLDYTATQMREYAILAVQKERERCARICDEMGEHWSAYKDTALLNGDYALSNAASGEPRAAEALARLIRGVSLKATGE